MQQYYLMIQVMIEGSERGEGIWRFQGFLETSFWKTKFCLFVEVKKEQEKPRTKVSRASLRSWKQAVFAYEIWRFQTEFPDIAKWTCVEINGALL